MNSTILEDGGAFDIEEENNATKIVLPIIFLLVGFLIFFMRKVERSRRRNNVDGSNTNLSEEEINDHLEIKVGTITIQI